jgi:hypothetical protein
VTPRLRKAALVAGILEIAVGLATVVATRDVRGLAFIPPGFLLIVLGRTRWVSARDGREL